MEEQIASQEEYKLVNIYDDLVKTNVRELMKSMDMCNCEKCFLDACAMVYNRKYTQFATTRKGELLGKIPDMNHSNHVELIVCITEVLQMVKEFPKH